MALCKLSSANLLTGKLVTSTWTNSSTKPRRYLCRLTCHSADMPCSRRFSGRNLLCLDSTAAVYDGRSTDLIMRTETLKRHGQPTLSTSSTAWQTRTDKPRTFEGVFRAGCHQPSTSPLISRMYIPEPSNLAQRFVPGPKVTRSGIAARDSSAQHGLWDTLVYNGVLMWRLAKPLRDALSAFLGVQ